MPLVDACNTALGPAHMVQNRFSHLESDAQSLEASCERTTEVMNSPCWHQFDGLLLLLISPLPGLGYRRIQCLLGFCDSANRGSS